MHSTAEHDSGAGYASLDALAFLLTCYDVWSATPAPDCWPCAQPPAVLAPGP